jgi:CMP-N,N'-diacetyllegionaminic acid synthase
MQKVLSLIPARGGSVRVPKKNIRPLLGRPLIDYAITASKESAFVNRIIVSTDSDEIMAISNKLGAETPFRRPPDISEDVPTEDVVIHAVKWLIDNEGFRPDIIVCLEPPSPFRKAAHIDACVEKLITSPELDSVITINSIRGARPEWYVRADNQNLLSPYTDYFTSQGRAILKFPASQIFEPIFAPNGVVFSCRTSTLLEYGSLVGEKCAGIEIPHEDTFDLDYPDDFQLCEAMMRQRIK